MYFNNRGQSKKENAEENQEIIFHHLKQQIEEKKKYEMPMPNQFYCSTPHWQIRVSRSCSNDSLHY